MTWRAIYVRLYNKKLMPLIAKKFPAYWV